jgi:hypothetical protein
MILRLVAAVLGIFVATSAAPAQRAPRPPFPAEKFSTQPVQGKQPAKTDPAVPDGVQKKRWDERSRHPAVEPK